MSESFGLFLRRFRARAGLNALVASSTGPPLCPRCWPSGAVAIPAPVTVAEETGMKEQLDLTPLLRAFIPCTLRSDHPTVLYLNRPHCGLIIHCATDSIYPTNPHKTA